MNEFVNQNTFKNFTPGRVIGPSEWLTVTQEMIDSFGTATLDHDPMHVDPEWAAAGPFGQTIAFGFLTVSLLTHMMHRALGTDTGRYDPTKGYYMNYGFDRLRLVSPVPCGSRIRANFQVAGLRPDSGSRSIVKFDVRVEVEGSERPAMVAEWLTVWVPPEVEQESH